MTGKIEIGRGEGDKFMSKFFLPRRTAYSTVMAELTDLANQAKITPKESANAIEPVEGSDTLEMMQISANYEAKYEDLVPAIDRWVESRKRVCKSTSDRTEPTSPQRRATHACEFPEPAV